MSVIALKWAYSQKVGNATAKNILGFLASHNFPGDTVVFKIKTIMSATEYGETAVKDALNLLCRKKLVIKEARYDENGRQLSNEYKLNIPNDYAEKFMEDYYDLSTAGGRQATPPPSAGDPSPRRQATPLNSNSNNNNINKRSGSSNDKKINNEPKQCAKFWEPGNPDYDRVNKKGNKT